MAQVGIPVSVTNHESPDGAGDIVYYVAHIDDNVYCKRPKGNFCTDAHVVFEPSFDRNQCRALAREKYRESMALQQLEISGDMSTAEAIMANRHKGAWNEALRLAVTKRLYSHDDVQPYPRFHSDSPVLLANFNSYNNDYELDIAKEVIAHACSFWWIYQDLDEESVTGSMTFTLILRFPPIASERSLHYRKA